MNFTRELTCEIKSEAITLRVTYEAKEAGTESAEVWRIISLELEVKHGIKPDHSYSMAEVILADCGDIARWKMREPKLYFLVEKIAWEHLSEQSIRELVYPEK